MAGIINGIILMFLEPVPFSVRVLSLHGAKYGSAVDSMCCWPRLRFGGLHLQPHDWKTSRITEKMAASFPEALVSGAKD